MACSRDSGGPRSTSITTVSARKVAVVILAVLLIGGAQAARAGINACRRHRPADGSVATRAARHAGIDKLVLARHRRLRRRRLGARFHVAFSAVASFGPVATTTAIISDRTTRHDIPAPQGNYARAPPAANQRIACGQ